MTDRTPHVIINPASGGGRTGPMQSQILESICRQFGNDISVCVTERPGHARESAQRAIAQKFRLILVVGGDGTINEVVNGMMAEDGCSNTDAELGIISCGTGHGLAQSLGLPSSIDEQAKIAAMYQTRNIDIGYTRFQDAHGVRESRFFTNELQIGVGAAVVARVAMNNKRFGGLIAYGLGTLMMLKDHPNQSIRVSLDGHHLDTRSYVGICIGNGARTAGGIRLTPSAKLDDGQMDVLFLYGQSLVRRLWLFPKVPSGRHIYSNYCSYLQARHVSLSSDDHVLTAADGELLGSLPCTIDVIPGALRVRCPHNGKGQ